jgi:GT2 family glycosyltransferase
MNGFDEIFSKGLGDYHEADGAFKIRCMGYRTVFNPGAALRHNVEIGKIEEARPASFYRIQNFLIFYLRYFRIDSPRRFFKVFLNVVLQNAYYAFKFVRTGKVGQLGAIPGTIVGLIRGLAQERNKCDLQPNRFCP